MVLTDVQMYAFSKLMPSWPDAEAGVANFNFGVVYIMEHVYVTPWHYTDYNMYLLVSRAFKDYTIIRP